MILSAQSIMRLVLASRSGAEPPGLDIYPFAERTVEHGMSYGLSAAGYDLRINDGMTLAPGDFRLATTVERIALPVDVMGQLADKSTWARRGIAVQNTIFEPGWRGYPTLEISNHGSEHIYIPSGAPIGQMIFHLLDHPTDRPYAGRYQDQKQVPTPAIYATEENVG